MDYAVRNMRFAIDDGVPHAWHRGERAVTTFFDNLSIFFPVGERFFVASVRAHRGAVTDEELLRDVRVFCGQEGMHGREHERYNRMLAARYPIAEMEQRVARLLARVSRVTPKREQLAATCALEHLTALMAHALLGNPRVLEGAHPEMAALWKWHAAEENEHKHVAYDVFVAAGGTYPERVVVMIIASVIFWAKVFEHQVRMMHRGGILFSLREWRTLARFLFVDPGALRALTGFYLQYFRPSFHPSDIDSRELLEAWRGGLETAVGDTA